jgi:LPS-assembly lipoprotein
LSFDRTFRRVALASGLALITVLAGCQVRPLYSEAEGTGQRLSSVGFAAPKTRTDQLVRNQLVFLTSGGAGETAHAEYDVSLTTKSTASNILETNQDDDDVAPSGVPVPGRVDLEVTYSMTRRSDGKVLKSAKRNVIALIDVSGQGYAKLRAVRDAENRAGREAAEFIRAEIAIVLAKEPKPLPVAAPTAWQK